MMRLPVHPNWVPILLLLLTSCSAPEAPDEQVTDTGAARSGSASDPGKAPVTVRVSQGSDVISLDPYFKNESPTFSVMRNVYETLTDYDANIELTPWLAHRWKNVGELEWVFELREGVVFHEGQPLTADDVVFSVRRALDWPMSRFKSEIPTVEHVEAVDDHTVRFRTRIPDAILPLRLASIAIMDREWTEAAIAEHGEEWLATNANGSGAYRVEEWIKDTRCVLTRHSDYWGESPVVERLEFNPTSNDATRMVMLQRGRIDIMVNVPPTSVKRAELLPGFRILKSPSLRLIYLGLDCGRDKTPGIKDSPPNPLKDLRVRQAILKSIDNRLIVKTIMGGNAEPADQLLPEGVNGYDPTIKLERPDYEGARRLLAEAGYPEGFTVRLDGPNDRYINDSKIIAAVAQELARIGIDVEANAMPKVRFFSEEEQGNCSFFLIGWSNTNGDGIGTFDHLLHTNLPEKSMGGSNNSTAYSHPRVDEICELASREFDPARREALVREANRVAVDDLVHIPLHYQMDIYAVSDKFEWTPRRDTQVRGIDIRLAGVGSGG